MHKSRYPSPYIALTHKGRREITFFWLPQELKPEEIFELTKLWVSDEIIKRGMACEYRYIADDDIGDHIELWCTTRRMNKKGFYGTPVKLWGKPEFIEKLHNLFQQAMQNGVQLKKETGSIYGNRVN